MTATDTFTPEELDAGEALFSRPWVFIKSVPSLEFLPESGQARNRLRRPLQCRQVEPDQRARQSARSGAHLQYARPHAGAQFLRAAWAAFLHGRHAGLRISRRRPRAKVEQWTRLVKDYLRGRPTLGRVFLLIDARHGLKSADRAVMALMDEAAVSYQAVLTKIDKIKPTDLARMQQTTADELRKHAAAYPTMLATSSQTSAGIARTARRDRPARQR